MSKVAVLLAEGYEEGETFTIVEVSCKYPDQFQMWL